MEIIDVSKVVLDEPTQKAFNKFRRKDKAILTPEQFNLLSEERLIKALSNGKPTNWGSPKGNSECEISDLGKKLRAYQYQQNRNQKTENIRYLVTTAIAIAAWVTAIVSIVLQYR